MSWMQAVQIICLTITIVCNIITISNIRHANHQISEVLIITETARKGKGNDRPRLPARRPA